ncbi:hypothetical protein IE53DRAFT_337364 [Violaceomyces palustris]|uniref:Uncharacterized protein n=1 Tax=Violaceomyces palustris TaxID=1673888 RepID=A0ACD0P867_9BASI|nr:hypothetical protein IE53DRAFT_337364 [Violaceomyces palustris]
MPTVGPTRSSDRARPIRHVDPRPISSSSSSSSSSQEPSHGSGGDLQSQRYWNRKVGRPLLHLLESNGYTSQQVERFRTFFTSVVSPSLGERQDRRVRGRGGSRWSSLMCDDGIPVEIGLAWKSKGGGGRGPAVQRGQVRFSIEAIDDQEVRSRSTNLKATRSLLSRLERQGHLASSGRRLFESVDEAVPLDLQVSRTRHMVGFDILRPTHGLDPIVNVKAYFVLPGLCSSPSHPTLKSQEEENPEAQLERILEAISHTVPSPGMSQLKEYLSSLPRNRRGRPVILSVDLDGPETGGGGGGGRAPSVSKTRVKVYWRFPDTDPTMIRSHMSLGGLWGEDVGKTAEKAWSTLMRGGETNVTKVDPYTSTGGSLFYFDLGRSFDGREGYPAPSKAYIPVRHLLPRSEAEDVQGGAGEEEEEEEGGQEMLCKRFVDLLHQSGRSSLVRSYLDSLLLSPPGGGRVGSPLSLTTSHTYICTEGSSNSPDFCVYLKPRLVP